MTRAERQRIKSSSRRGRRMALARWAKDRAHRERLANLTPEQAPNHIVRRIIVIDHERTVREIVIWSWDSMREARRKVREVLREGARGERREGE